MTLARIRFGLAALATALTPGTAFLWAQLHVSGYTWRDDGSRDLGHLAKALSWGPGFALAGAAAVLIVGTGTLVLARRGGALTAPRLLRAGIGVAVALGVAVSLLVALASPDTVASATLAGLLKAGLAIVAVCGLAAALLGLGFVVLAGVPFTARAQPVGSGRIPRLLAGIVVVSTGAATCAALVWIVSLMLWSTQHPCNCG